MKKTRAELTKELHRTRLSHGGSLQTKNKTIFVTITSFCLLAALPAQQLSWRQRKTKRSLSCTKRTFLCRARLEMRRELFHRHLRLWVVRRSVRVRIYSHKCCSHVVGDLSCVFRRDSLSSLRDTYLFFIISSFRLVAISAIVIVLFLVVVSAIYVIARPKQQSLFLVNLRVLIISFPFCTFSTRQLSPPSWSRPQYIRPTCKGRSRAVLLLGYCFISFIFFY